MLLGPMCGFKSMNTAYATIGDPAAMIRGMVHDVQQDGTARHHPIVSIEALRIASGG